MESASRHVVASAARISPDDRLDLVVHAVAQLPETVSADIYGQGPLHGQLVRIARAYGIEDRVQVRRELPPGSPPGIVVYPSLHNAATAPLRPDDASGGGLVLDEMPAERYPEQALDAGAYREGPPRVREVRSMAALLDSLVPGDRVWAPVLGDARKLAGHRVGIITNYPTHYRVRLFNLLADRLSGQAAIRVFFTDADPRARAWMQSEPLAFDHRFMRALPIRLAATDLPLALERDLRRYQPTVLIAAGFSPVSSTRVARLSAKAGIPWGVWSGEIDTLATAQSSLRRLQRRRLLRRAGFGIAYGYRSGEYLRGLAPTLPLVHGRNTVPFPSGTVDRESDVVEVLAVSRAVPRKGLDVLIDAVRLLDLPCRLTLAGGGSELPALRRRAGGDERIRLLGAVDSDRVGDLYRNADIFAFPTRVEPFGLAMVEAFAAGLAVVTSAAPGALGDLAIPDRNCLVVPDHEPSSWAAALRRVIEDRGLRRRIGDAASAIVRSRWTIEHAVGAMICGLALGVSDSFRSPGNRPTGEDRT